MTAAISDSIAPMRTHGHSFSSTYGSWKNIRRRCTDPGINGYERYGGRGIKVCDRWLGREGFANFLADMGERPAGQTLDRFPDKDGNYEPTNCRWATASTQQRNTTATAFEPHEIQQIKWLVNDLKCTQVDVARFFGVGKGHINQIVHGRIWKEQP